MWHRAVLMGFIAGMGYVASGGTALAFSVSYDQTVTANGQTMTAKVQMKDGQFRIESPADNVSTILIHNATGTYSYLPEEQMAMKMPEVSLAQQPVPETDNYLGFLNSHQATRVRSEVMDGYACDVYEFASPTGGMATAWVWKEKHFPIRIVQATPQGPMVAQLSHIQFDVPIPDAVFELPEGVEVMGLGDMGQMMDPSRVRGKGSMPQQRRPGTP